MIESIQRFIQDACLSALGLIGGVCIFYWISVMARRFFARVRAVGISLALLLSLAAVIVTGEAQKQGGGTGTTGILPVATVANGHAVSTGGTPVVPVGATSPRTSATMPFRAAKWNVRGAWNDSFRYAFADGWEFPFGTGHLDRVEVCSQGRIIPRYGSSIRLPPSAADLQTGTHVSSLGRTQ